MELTSALREETGWGKHTVITMLSRLEAKGVVHHQEGHGQNIILPIYPRGCRPDGDRKLPG
jgi:BlaI family penicillinase repressor